MSTIKTKNVQVGTDGTASNNFTIYVPGTPDGTVRIGNGDAGAATDIAKVDSDGFKFTNSIQIGTDAVASNNFTIYQPSTPDGTLRIGVGNADSPTEVGRFDSNGYLPTVSTSPLVFAYLSANQSVTASTWTKVTLDGVVWDTTSSFDATNNRYQPSVAGYYQINTTVQFPVAPTGYLYIALYKNGSIQNFLHGVNLSSGNGDWRLNGSIIVDLNGTTDYIELYAYATGTSPSVGGNANTRNTWFQAKLIQRT